MHKKENFHVVTLKYISFKPFSMADSNKIDAVLCPAYETEDGNNNNQLFLRKKYTRKYTK